MSCGGSAGGRKRPLRTGLMLLPATRRTNPRETGTFCPITRTFRQTFVIVLAAARHWGSSVVLSEERNHMGSLSLFERLGQDLRYGARVLARNPGFAAVALLTLGLGIGANTAIFSLVEGLLLKPLPYPHPERLVVPATIFQRLKTDTGSVAYADILDWKAQTDLFEAVSALRFDDMDVTGGDEPERVRALAVDEDYFRVMGSPLLLGRPFTVQDNHPGAGREVVLGFDLWMRRFGGDPHAVGSRIEAGGVPFLVIGVTRKDSTLPSEAEIFQPLGLAGSHDADLLRRDNHVFVALARLKAGTSLPQAQSKLTVMGARIAREEVNRAGTTWKLHPAAAFIIGPTLRQTLAVLLAAALFVLLIACVNVANLLLAQGSSRSREVAIRNALGADWKRLAAQFLAESALLSAAGGLAGILAGYWGLKGLIRFAPPDIPWLDRVHIDFAVLGFTAALCLAASIAAGIVPALHAARLAPMESFRDSSHTAHGSLRGGRLRSVLVVSELALAIVLLTGAGLLIRSFSGIQKINPGFPTGNLLTMQVSLPHSRYPGQPQVSGGFEQITRAIGRVPGVVSASAVSSLPAGGGGSYLLRLFLREGQPEPPASSDVQAAWSVVQPGYFQTMGIPVLRGRVFTDGDTENSTPVIIISHSMARQMFPNQDALGRRIRSWRDENLYREIVGVVGDLRYFGLTEGIENNVYVPHTQNWWRGMEVVVRTQGDPKPLLPSIRSQIWSQDRKLPISEIKTMDQIIDSQLARPRFSMFLLGIFGATALVLAAIGTYGVMSFAVAQRAREIGVRMALGATRTAVLRMIAGNAFRLAAAGVVGGIAGALALTRLMKTLLFEVSPTDAQTFVLVPVLLMLVTFAAAYLPARRAAGVDPMVTLRHE